MTDNKTFKVIGDDVSGEAVVSNIHSETEMLDKLRNELSAIASADEALHSAETSPNLPIGAMPFINAAEPPHFHVMLYTKGEKILLWSGVEK